MGSKQIRLGQLIAPFGPGSLYTDRFGVPHLIAGLDHWYKRWDSATGHEADCSDPGEFEIFEQRLSELLRVERFRRPPDYRQAVARQEPPPNAGLTVPALRFPRWYRNTQSGRMRLFNLDTRAVDRPAGGGRWQPVRFISVCGEGHISDFPWKAWIGCSCAGEGQLVLTDRGGSELSSITVRCESCPEGSEGRRGRSLSGTTTRPRMETGEKTEFEKAGIRCSCERPWLGEGAEDGLCVAPLVAALINQTNIYFPRTISALSLPRFDQEDGSVADAMNELERLPDIAIIKLQWKMKYHDQAAATAASSLRQVGMEIAIETISEALSSLFSGEKHSSPDAAQPAHPESELQSFRREEFNVIRNGFDDPKLAKLRVVAGRVPPEFSAWLSRITLVERLCETRVFYGFDRLEPSHSPLSEMPESAMHQLFRAPPTDVSERWLPAVEVFGEGIYIELREDTLTDWQRENTAWIQQRLTAHYVARLQDACWQLAPLQPADISWAARFLVVHTLAHLVTTQLVFECGYSTASLRERLFVSSDPTAPMAAFLIYTAAGDSEGTLGGLVRLGTPQRLGPLLARALSRASWCSADPVCSENLGGQGSRLANLAACHACALLPETSCETINQGLDRALVLGTPDERSRGLMSEVVERATEYAIASEGRS
jgi:hypothetical protein